jgi:hypothetical protein
MLCQDITALPASIPTGALTLLSTQTASASATISFTTGLDSTYSSYVFKFIDINPATDNVDFTFNMSTDGGSTYAVTKTTTYFSQYHDEADTTTHLGYDTSSDLAQSTAFQPLVIACGNGADKHSSGTLQLFNPSSTTFVKHFVSNVNTYTFHDYIINAYSAGYGNTTSAIDAVQFKFSSGNIDDGIIKLYGVS